MVVLDADVRFGPALVYCPDVSVYAPERLAGVPEVLTLAPDLILEVLSPRNRPLDLITKRDDYERFGVGEYWVLDPDTNEVRAFQRASGTDRYGERTVTSQTVTSAASPGVTLDLRAVAAALRSRSGPALVGSVLTAVPDHPETPLPNKSDPIGFVGARRPSGLGRLLGFRTRRLRRGVAHIVGGVVQARRVPFVAIAGLRGTARLCIRGIGRARRVLRLAGFVH